VIAGAAVRDVTKNGGTPDAVFCEGFRFEIDKIKALLLTL